jgi:hypothetical protein
MPRIAPLVFVSSTRDDLSEYRAAVQQSFPALDLDVLYRGMEFFCARPNRPHDVIIQELLECDLYLGILAHSYGTSDPESGLSFTELEYQTAKREGIPTIFFLIDSRYRKDNIEKHTENQQKLEEFKAEVTRETVCESFTTPADLVDKVGRSLKKWLREQEVQWRQMRHVPLSGWENDDIRRLYSSNSRDVIDAISHLHRVDCRAAFEHFYSLLHRNDLDMQVAENIFRQLKFSHDDERVSQMLLNIIQDVPRYRALAIHAIGERATLPERSMTKSEVDGVLALSTDPGIDVRYEVAHALGKIGARYQRYYSPCYKYLEVLKADKEQRVSDKASLSIQRLPHRGRGAVGR